MWTNIDKMKIFRIHCKSYLSPKRIWQTLTTVLNSMKSLQTFSKWIPSPRNNNIILLMYIIRQLCAWDWNQTPTDDFLWYKQENTYVDFFYFLSSTPSARKLLNFPLCTLVNLGNKLKSLDGSSVCAAAKNRKHFAVADSRRLGWQLSTPFRAEYGEWNATHLCAWLWITIECGACQLS